MSENESTGIDRPKQEWRSCWQCTHKKAMPSKVPCVRCHNYSRWHKMSERQVELARIQSAQLEEKTKKEQKTNYRSANFSNQ
jgi:uncharacterized paraquat-inducible protein A